MLSNSSNSTIIARPSRIACVTEYMTYCKVEYVKQCKQYTTEYVKQYLNEYGEKKETQYVEECRVSCGSNEHDNHRYRLAGQIQSRFQGPLTQIVLP